MLKPSSKIFHSSPLHTTLLVAQNSWKPFVCLNPTLIQFFQDGNVILNPRQFQIFISDFHRSSTTLFVVGYICTHLNIALQHLNTSMFLIISNRTPARTSWGAGAGAGGSRCPSPRWTWRPPCSGRGGRGWENLFSFLPKLTIYLSPGKP